MRTPVVLSFLVVTALANAPTHADDVEFAKDIEPILAQHCYACHGENEDKGGLQLHTPEAIADSETVVAGELDDSDLYALIVLPEDDEELMPKGKEPLTAREADLIRRWIVDGAVMEDAPMPQTGDAETEGDEPAVPAAPAEAIDALRNVGALVMPLAAGDNRLSVGFGSRASEVGDEQVALLDGLAEQLVWLDLAGTQVTAAGLAPISNLSKLTRVHLERTDIGDDALTHLTGLADLEYLNLYGTNVTDAGIESLKGMKRLRKLYLWKTQASYAAVKELQSVIKGLEANLGHDHPEVVREKLMRRIERAKKAREAAAADEKNAQAAKKAAIEQEEAANKELAALAPAKEAAGSGPEPNSEAGSDGKPERDEEPKNE